MNKRDTDLLHRLYLDSDFLRWAVVYPSLCHAWDACAWGDRLLWLAAKVGVRQQDLALAAVACARPALKYVPEGEDALLIALDYAEMLAMGLGGVTLEDVRAAADAAGAADAAYYAADAANAAVNAATSVSYAAAANASYAAVANASYAAVAAAACGSGYAARADSLRHSADLVRAYIPWSTLARAIRSMKP